MPIVLVASETKEAIHSIESTLQSEYIVETVSNRQAALKVVAKRHPEFIFIDIGLLWEEGAALNYKEVLQNIWAISPNSEVIIMSPKEMIRDAVKALRAGASEYITYPIINEEVMHVIDSICEYASMQTELDYLRDKFWASDSLEIIQTEHSSMKEIFEKIRLVAPTRTTVLITGETGTGKGILAKLIHHHSNRKNDQFIQVHCGSIPDTLLESELFGHEKGAFTGAINRKLGKFEIANGGTIFLDEVGTLTPSAQIKLLQVLQEGIFQRVGGEETIEVDVRVISATNLEMKEACENGKFRKDLFYRLNVFSIEVPPLRERVNDIPHFIDLFLKKLERTGQKNIHGMHPDVVKSFKRYPWPGNIRELENIMERAYILGSAPMLEKKDFPGEVVVSESPETSLTADSSITLAEVRRKAVDVAENQYIRELLASYNGKIQESAGAAGITTRQLNKLMVKHNINKKDFKLK